MTSEYFNFKRNFENSQRFPVAPMPITLAYKKNWLVSTCNNFTAVFVIKSLVRKRPYLVFGMNISDFFQRSVAKEQLQYLFPKVCEQV